MDNFALRVGNLLVGNDEGEAAVEMTVLGPELRVLNDVTAAFTGAPFSPRVNGECIPMWQSLLLRRGDIVSLSAGAPDSGVRAYLTLGGGIDVPLVMGSRSTHILSKLGGYCGRLLTKGDVLSVPNAIHPELRSLRADQIPTYPEELLIRVIPGPQADYFTLAGLETLFSGEYQITPRSDRRGYVLAGPKIEHARGPDIISDGILPGCIQVPGDGMPIILLADCQTTGGFAKIGTVISSDLDRLGQACPGQKVRFQRVDVAQAHRILHEMEDRMSNIRSYILNGC
jgi:antagonist of KipI